MKRVRGERARKEFNVALVEEFEAGTLRSHSGGECTQVGEDLCDTHGGCVLEGETVVLCEDGEAFRKAT